MFLGEKRRKSRRARGNAGKEHAGLSHQHVRGTSKECNFSSDLPAATEAGRSLSSKLLRFFDILYRQ